jgi:transposase
MAKTHPPYAPEFRRQMVELVRAGRDPADLAREFEPSSASSTCAAEVAAIHATWAEHPDGYAAAATLVTSAQV